jgi:hypothetical protein
MLSNPAMPPPSRGHVLRRLQKLCQHFGRLPQSCLLSESDIAVETRDAVSKSAYSDVFRGLMGQDQVALKVLRVHADNVKNVEKVRLSLLLDYIQVTISLYRRFATRLLFGGISVTQILCRSSECRPRSPYALSALGCPVVRWLHTWEASRAQARYLLWDSFTSW